MLTLTSFDRSDLPERVFEGQILTVSVVVTFLAVFLLREWILQNAGPGPQQEVNQGRIPGPEGFRAEMRAQWRQRRLLAFDEQDRQLEPLLRRVIPNPNPRRPVQIPPQELGVARDLAAFPEMWVEGPHEYRNDARPEGRDETANDDEQWVDEDDWMDDDPAEASFPMRATAGNAADTSIADTHESRQIDFDESPVDTLHHEPAVEQGPAPSLLQQLRRQHRDHADPNMSFEEFLIHQRHSMADTAEPFPREPLYAMAGEASRPPVDEATQDQMRQEFDRFFRPAEPEETFPRELPLDPRAVSEEDRARESGRRVEQLQGAAQVADSPPMPRRGGLDRQRELDRQRDMDINRRVRQDVEDEEDRRALDAAYLVLRQAAEAALQEPVHAQDNDEDDEPIAEVDGGEEVEMGPEPGFDEEDEDEEGGLIIDGDVDGILEGMCDNGIQTRV